MPLYLVIVGVIIVFFQKGIATAVGIYNVTYYMKSESLIPLYMLITTLPVIVGMAITGLVVKRTGNRKASIYSLALVTILTAVLFVIPPQSILLTFVAIGLSSFFLGITSVAVTGIVAETVDYTELKTGIRADGVIFSFNSFSIQLGGALASGLAGILLANFGYVPNSLEQSSTALMGINLMRSLIPAAFCGLSLIAIAFYPINKKDYEEISTKLKEKHKTSPSSNTENVITM
jgi:glycoside/pentoside/hexuronide:cation symporter, GPH family